MHIEFCAPMHAAAVLFPRDRVARHNLIRGCNATSNILLDPKRIESRTLMVTLQLQLALNQTIMPIRRSS